jgi:hypothetical protein
MHISFWLKGALCLALWGCQTPVPLAAAASSNAELTAAVADDARSLFRHYDLDHDGQLSPTEAAALSLPPEVFNALDTNHNGSLSEAEFVSPQRIETLSLAFTSLGQELVKAEDLNHDGKLSWSEYQLGMLVPWPGPTVATPVSDPLRASFDAADVDHIGFVTPAQAPRLVAFLLRTGYYLQIRSH